jgi:hypothetical protein
MGATVTDISAASRITNASALASLPDGTYEVPVNRVTDASYYRADSTFVPHSTTSQGTITVRKMNGQVHAAIYSRGGHGPAGVIQSGFVAEAVGNNTRLWLPIDANGQGVGVLLGRDPYGYGRPGSNRSEIYGSTWGVWLKMNGDRLEASYSYFGKTPRQRGGYPWAPAHAGSVKVPASRATADAGTSLPTVFADVVGDLAVRNGKALFTHGGTTYEVRPAAFAMHPNMPLEMTAERLAMLQAEDGPKGKAVLTGQIGKPKGGPHFIMYAEEIGIAASRA